MRNGVDVMVQDIRVRCSACGRQSRVASVSGERTLTLSGGLIICPGCRRRVAIPRAVYSYNPASAVPLVRPADG